MTTSHQNGPPLHEYSWTPESMIGRVNTAIPAMKVKLQRIMPKSWMPWFSIALHIIEIEKDQI